MDKFKRLANHFYEAGYLKRTVRSGQRGYLTADYTDTIASHTYRTAIIAWHLGTLVDDVDPNKLAAMALFHDLDEARSGDADWVSKRYVKINNDQINNDQSEGLDGRFLELLEECDKKESIEAKLVKDADTLELILTLKELAHSGNQEAISWLKGLNFPHEPDDYNQLKYLLTSEGKQLGRVIYDTDPGEWWHFIATNKNL